MSEIKELKRKKEDFRIEIRKNKQDKTFNTNRQKLIQKLFEEEGVQSNEKTATTTIDSSNQQQNNKNAQELFSQTKSDGQQIDILNSASQEKNQLFSKQNNNQQLRIGQIYNVNEITELLGQLLDYLQKSTSSLMQNSSTQIQQVSQGATFSQQDIQIAQNMIREILLYLMKFEDLFKQINDKNCHLFEQSQIHVRLFEYLQMLLSHQQIVLSLDLQGAEALLSKVFQYLVNVCLNTDKALEDCFKLNIINYFVNVMSNSNFYAQKSKMILFSINLLDHIASRNNTGHIKMLTDQEILRKILTLMRDIRESILKNQENSQNSQTENLKENQQQLQTNINRDSIESFYRKLLAHLSSILSNISRHKELIDSSDKTMLLSTCQQLLIIICNEINERNKSHQKLKKLNSTLPQSQQQQNKEIFEEEQEEEEESDILSKEKNSSSIYKTKEEQNIYEELALIESNIAQSLLNIIELMEAEDLDIYISENISFLILQQQQILPIEEQTAENSTRIQVYGELLNSLLMGDEEQIELVIETFQILDYIRNMIYSPFQNIIIIGLSCYFNILISISSYQFDQIYEYDKNIVCRLLHLINNYSNNTQLQAESLNTMSAFVDKADKSVIDEVLRPTNIMNIIIQKLDPENDSIIISAALSLLESLLKSEEEGHKKQSEDDEMNDDDDENEETVEQSTSEKFQVEDDEDKPDNYWALKFQSNPAGNHQVTKLFNSCHSKEIILKLDNILDEYME